MYKSFAATAALATAVAISMAANADDLPRAAPVPGPAPVYAPPPFTWTGLYVGGHVGGAWAHRGISDARFGLDFGRSSDGVFIGGAQVGYNYQFNTFVLGAEA